MIMNILNDIFGSFGTFSLYAPGVDANMDLRDLHSSGITARKRVETVITPAVFGALLKEPEESAMTEALRSAMANMTMATQLVFDSINRRKNKIDVYKHEQEAMKRAYTENFSGAMDTLVKLLTDGEPSEGSPAGLWRKSRYYTLMAGCPIGSADGFDAVYPIDASCLYFFRTLPLQKECMDERMGAYFDKLTDDNRTQLEPMLLLALAKKTVAKSLRRFDLLEFPPTIRNLFDDSNMSRHGSTEASGALSLADRLDREADEAVAMADAVLESIHTSDFSSFSAYNREDDNIIMMP